MDGNSAVCIVHFLHHRPLRLVVSLVMHDWLFICFNSVCISKLYVYIPRSRHCPCFARYFLDVSSIHFLCLLL
jgi:hypothetical protein